MKEPDFNALQALAADNARLCEIALAADRLAQACEAHLDGDPQEREIERALAAYKVARNGQ